MDTMVSISGDLGDQISCSMRCEYKTNMYAMCISQPKLKWNLTYTFTQNSFITLLFAVKGLFDNPRAPVGSFLKERS